MSLKFNVVGLGHPTRWHVSINNDYATKQEAENLKARLEYLIDNTCIIPAKDFDKVPTAEEIRSAKEAENYYLKHEPVSFDSKTKLALHIKALERAGYVTSEWNEVHDWQGNPIKAYKVFKINFDAVKK